MVEEVDLEEGEVTESEEEHSGEEENHHTKPAKNVNPPANKFPEPVRSNEKKDLSKHRRNEGAAADNKKDLPRKYPGGKKGDRKRNDDREPRGFEKSRRKSPEADPEATFEDELDAYQNSQRSLPRGRDREPLESRDSRRRPSPNSRRPPRGGRAGGPRSGRPPRESAEIRPSRKEKRVPCKFFLEGRCKFGDECPFSHDVLQTKKLEACKFYAGGACNKGPLCVYMHQEFPCKFFHTGQKCFSGDNCRFTHERLSGDQKLALENYLEKENKFKDDRHQHRENPHRSPPPQQEEYRDPSRGGLLPTPNDGPTNWDNSRRRPDFFRETLPDRNSQEPKDFGGQNSHMDRNGDDGFGRHRNNFDNDRPSSEGMYGRGPNQEEFPFRDNLPSSRPYGDVISPRGSEHSDDAFPSSVAPQAPRLLARLQQRAQQMMLPEKPEEPAVKKDDDSLEHQNVENHYPLDESPERHLVINEPTSQEPAPRAQVQDSHSSMPQWGGSDDEDDGSDQFLANSLKRQQEPNRGPWSRYEGEWRSIQEFQLYADEPFMGEQLLNRGKVLLSVPLPQEPYYPPQPEFVAAYAPQGTEYGDQQWSYQDPQMAYQHPYPSEHFHDPHAMPLPPVAGAVDPRLARAGNFDFPYPPHEPEMMPYLPVEPQVNPTLEAVMQQLLGVNRLNPAAPARPVVAPEIEASLERNPEPPMYRLQPFVAGSVIQYNVMLYERLLAFRTAEDLAIDPRVSKITKSLGPPPAPQSAPSVSPVAPSRSMFSLDATEADESKKASQDFDAITAMLAQALKKREAEVDNDKNGPEKKMRRVAAPQDSAYAVS